MRWQLTMAGLVVLAGIAPAAESGDLLPPVPVQVGGRPLDVEHDGHAAPFAGDLDGDGRLTLLVGQYYEGRLRVYRNTGTRRRPVFDSFTWFEAGGKPGRVPEG
jgi:hypothetical protein